MPFEGFIRVGQRSRSHGLNELSLEDNILILLNNKLNHGEEWSLHTLKIDQVWPV